MRYQNLSMNPINDTYCDLDLIRSSLLKKCKFALLPTITNIINYSLAFGIFPDQFKSRSVHPLLKKPNCDKDDLSNYMPISHLSFLSKLTERVVKIALQILFLIITCLTRLSLPILHITPLKLHSLQFMIMLLGSSVNNKLLFFVFLTFLLPLTLY
jgi:hypothetical protein